MKASLGASRLEALLESAQLLHASLDLDDLLQHLLRTVMGRLLVTRALIAVSRNGEMRVALTRGLPGLSVGHLFDETDSHSTGVDLFYRIGSEEEAVGWLGLSKPPRALSQEDEEFLKALLGIAASGINNSSAHGQAKQLNDDLNQRIQDLRTLLELVQSLNSTLDPAEVAHLLALTLTGRWVVGRYALVAWKEGHPPIQLKRGLQLPPVEELLKDLVDIDRAALVPDLPESGLKQRLQERQGAVIFPLRTRDKLMGAVALGPRPGGLSYQASDLEFGSGLAAQATVAFENSWHFQETLEKRQIEQEVGLAANIQKDLFPGSLPRLSGCDLAARSLAARQVGGDYYDVLSFGELLPESPRVLCVADVSGKGIPASLLMSSIQATLRALLIHEVSVVELVSQTSRLLYATTPGNKYATAILARVDPATGHVRYVNAGHNDGIVLRAGGEIERLKSTGPPLGLIPGIPFAESEMQLASGDVLVLYSDGVVEAQNGDEEEFDEDRFLAVLESVRHLRSEEIIAAVMRAIETFVGEAPQHDDITLLVLKRQ